MLKFFPILKSHLFPSVNWLSKVFFASSKIIKNKDIYIGTATSDHDLGIKCNKILNWLAKQYRVRIIVEKKGSIASQRPKQTILDAVLEKCKGRFKETSEPKADDLRLIVNVQGIEENSQLESSSSSNEEK